MTGLMSAELMAYGRNENRLLRQMASNPIHMR